MQIIKNQILACLIETGRLPAGSSIEILTVTTEQGSDYARIELTATKKRCCKPFMYWNVCVDMARELIRWDTTTFYYL